MTMSLENDAFFKAFANSMKHERQLKGLVVTLKAVAYDPMQFEDEKEKALTRIDYVHAVLRERRDREHTRAISEQASTQDSREDCSQPHEDSEREAEEQQVGQVHQDGVDREAGVKGGYLSL